MARFRDQKIPTAIRESIWKEFCGIVAGLKRSDDVNRFLSDLMNRQERLMLARRLQIAALLEADFTYEEIQKILRVARGTIGRVQRWLNFGRDGYKRATRLLGTKDRKTLRAHFRSYYH